METRGLMKWFIAQMCGTRRDHHPEHEPAEEHTAALGTSIGAAARGPGELDETIASWIENPPKVYGEEIDAFPGDKVILLIAGDEVSERVIVDMGPPVSIPNPSSAYYEVVPPSWAPPGATVRQRFTPVANMKRAWADLIRRYTSPEFVDAGWVLVPIRGTSTGVIDAALAEILDRGPEALVVHYFGHGDADYRFVGASRSATTRPYLQLRGHSIKPFQLPNPDGTVERRFLEVPDPQAISKYYVDVLAFKLRADFPDIPLVLIADGCELAQSLDHKASLTGMVVSIDRVYCGTSLGLFSVLYAASAAPADFDQFAAQMPGKLATVNASLTRNQVAYVDVARGYRWFKGLFKGTKPKQRASMTTWQYP